MNIAIASGKGGTGKTTISTNLASYLSEFYNVVLCDIDVEEPNSGLFINGTVDHKQDMFKMVPQWVEDECTLCGICQKVCNFHAVIQLGPNIMVFPELCHSCYTCSELCPSNSLPMVTKKMGQLTTYHFQNLKFVESRLDIGEEQAVPLIAQTINYINNNFSDDSIRIFDSPPGTSCPVIEATKDADIVILVTEPTPFGLHDLKLAVETMKELNKLIGVIINRDGIGNNDVIEYCNQQSINVIAKIPNSRKIAESYSKGKLLFNEFPEVKKQLENIRDFILENKKQIDI